MLYFATLFDSNYLAKGLALCKSLQTHVPQFRLFVLCLDEAVFRYLTDLKNTRIHPLRLADIEKGNDKLLAAKANRSKVEYYFTLSPVLPLYILENFNNIPFITTLDADIYFFSDPSPVYKEFESKSILITPHRFSPNIRHHEKHGLYNVSFQIFRNDDEGTACLRQWRDNCIEWCFDRLEDDKFADQKYLDRWPLSFSALAVLQHEGAALAPWNIGQYRITKNNSAVHSNNSLLVFYHFHGLKPASRNWYMHGVDHYDAEMTPALMTHVYKPYINELVAISKLTGGEAPGHPLRLATARKYTAMQVLRSHSTLFRLTESIFVLVDLRPLFRFASRIRSLFGRN